MNRTMGLFRLSRIEAFGKPHAVHGISTIKIGTDLIGVFLIQHGSADHRADVRVGTVQQFDG